MTHFLQRSALILLATTALGVSPVLARPVHGAKASEAPKAANGKIVTLKGERAAYVVKKGDTLATIADGLDTTVAELMSANKLKKTSILQPGDVLKGPVVAKKAYVVANGDTVFSIAKRLHVTVDELRDENDLSAKTHIRPGQRIRLPSDFVTPAILAADGADKGGDGADQPSARGAKGRRGKTLASDVSDDTGSGDRLVTGKVVTSQGGPETYRVKKGDTLAKVADRLDTTVAQLKADNHLKSTALAPGLVLKGPKFTEHAYVARPGDTLALIAQRFGVSVDRLRIENDMSRRAVVRSGQKVYLPDGYRDRGAIREADLAGTPERTARNYPRPAEAARDQSPQPPSRPQPYEPSGTTVRTYAPLSGTPTTPPPAAAAAPAAAPAPSDVQISQMGQGRFVWPLQGAILSDFGVKPAGQRNDGINIQAASGAAVRAAADGDVVYAGDQVPGFGNLVLIKHPDGWATAYSHLSRIDVKAQQKVTQGQQIGQAGISGGVPEPQLHFEVRYGARAVDPKMVLPKSSIPPA
ncbi:LysM peptidoglycan-binding domain-containing protein [Phenylobacterium sp.]|jgi:murein DD-endopeptidase MepM/ murein hydrolase activator NlpD|uniref:LysM peptidoglycan-binding domain-containing protein n=1 Tax=Phenylobacterium sp. TaxID=1871053 RepID=UPI002E317E4B|nr:LysM peptidoglycan-binding domain-containing protein [Phenylobacterium sp.]HEX4711338.1 LysM peptidoglycan-binding domain-containing protein [Phenylobacterium sp.]